MGKRNSQRPDAPWVAYIKQCTRHYIETVFSGITSRFPKSIQAVTIDGFLLKPTPRRLRKNPDPGAGEKAYQEYLEGRDSILSI